MILGIKRVPEGLFLVPVSGPVDIEHPLIGGQSDWIVSEDEYDILAMGVLPGILFMGTQDMDLFQAVRELASFTHPWQEDFRLLESLSFSGREMLILKEVSS